jgi:hypothetical protein
MAIAPNTTFVSGAILTAAQQNAFGFGIVAFQTDTASANYTSETVNITSTSFTAIANRYYRITYYQPQLQINAANGYSLIHIRKGTTTAGAIINRGFISNPTSGLPTSGTVSAVTTLTAGAQQVCATITSTNTTSTNTSATNIGYLLVEDIGPA